MYKVTTSGDENTPTTLYQSHLMVVEWFQATDSRFWGLADAHCRHCGCTTAQAFTCEHTDLTGISMMAAILEMAESFMHTRVCRRNAVNRIGPIRCHIHCLNIYSTLLWPKGRSLSSLAVVNGSTVLHVKSAWISMFCHRAVLKWKATSAIAYLQEKLSGHSTWTSAGGHFSCPLQAVFKRF